MDGKDTGRTSLFVGMSEEEELAFLADVMVSIRRDRRVRRGVGWPFFGEPSTEPGRERPGDLDPVEGE